MGGRGSGRRTSKRERKPSNVIDLATWAAAKRGVDCTPSLRLRAAITRWPGRWRELTTTLAWRVPNLGDLDVEDIAEILDDMDLLLS